MLRQSCIQEGHKTPLLGRCGSHELHNDCRGKTPHQHSCTTLQYTACEERMNAAPLCCWAGLHNPPTPHPPRRHRLHSTFTSKRAAATSGAMVHFTNISSFISAPLNNRLQRRSPSQRAQHNKAADAQERTHNRRQSRRNAADVGVNGNSDQRVISRASKTHSGLRFTGESVFVLCFHLTINTRDSPGKQTGWGDG